jgi:hypothetical protein
MNKNGSHDMNNRDVRELVRRIVRNLRQTAELHPDRKYECLNEVAGWEQLFSRWGFVL